LKIENLSPLAKASDIYEFSIALNEYKLKYPSIVMFIETLDSSLCAWEPFYEAIRLYFNEKRISEIASRQEFMIAIKGYINIETMYFHYQPHVSKELVELRRCVFARFSEIELISDLINQGSPANYIYHAPLVIFEGSTGGLEHELVEWIAKMHNSQSLFDDEDFDYLEESEVPLNSNMEALKSYWLEKDSRNTTMYDGFTWHVIDANASVDLDLGDRTTFVTIHVLSQIRANLNNEIENEKEYYKISLLRTGLRDEYDSAMDRSLLALQVIMFQESANVDVPYLRNHGQTEVLQKLNFIHCKQN
jgi:hypothetical protein